MAITNSNVHGVHVVEVREKDLTSAHLDQMRMAIAPALKTGCFRFVFDLEGVELIDSAVVGLILKIANEGHKHGGDVAVCSATAHVLETIQALHLGQYLQIVDSREEALRNLGVEPPPKNKTEEVPPRPPQSPPEKKAVNDKKESKQESKQEGEERSASPSHKREDAPVQFGQRECAGVWIVESAVESIVESDLPRLRAAFEPAAQRRMTRTILDFSKIESLGSGVELVAEICRQMREAGGDLRIVGLPDSLVDELADWNVNPPIQIFETIDEALDSYDLKREEDDSEEQSGGATKIQIDVEVEAKPKRITPRQDVEINAHFVSDDDKKKGTSLSGVSGGQQRPGFVTYLKILAIIAIGALLIFIVTFSFDKKDGAGSAENNNTENISDSNDHAEPQDSGSAVQPENSEEVENDENANSTSG